MAGVQCSQQIDDLGTPHLPHHKSVGSHPEGLPDEISQGHRPCSFDVGRSGLKPNDMRMGWIKLAGVLHHQQSLISPGQREEAAQQRCLPRAGAPADEEGDPSGDQGVQPLRSRGR